ncbi:UNVERIFIED_CONTAM: hypothetical protein HDU68_010203 [Siphonaria sp. JEL0065]|nr:hypothetical protein HDU68_010203 [Siphonaria sp. JEL0065]
MEVDGRRLCNSQQSTSNGKSAILTGVMVNLDGKAEVTDCAQRLKSLVTEGKTPAQVLEDCLKNMPVAYAQEERSKGIHQKGFEKKTALFA